MSNKSGPVIIGISAKARGGKDQAAEFMKEKLEFEGKKVLITHYADLLKFILKEYYGWDGQKDEKGRSLLQYVGTEVFRGNCPNAWDKIMEYMIKGFGNTYEYVIIADCRFFDDVNWFDEAGFKGYTVRINRPGFVSNLTEEQKNHRSEVELDNYKFDYVINNDSDLEGFKKKVYDLIDEITNVLS